MLFSALPALCLSQGTSSDSLKRILPGSKDDINKVSNLLQLGKNYLSSSPEEAIRYSLEAKEVAEKIKYRAGVAFALKNIGMVYYNQTRYVETIEYWNQSYRLFDSVGDKVNEALLLNNLGSVYMNQGDDPKALEYYFKSLQIAEQSKDIHKIAIAMANIGTIYSNNKFTYDKALEYYLKALPLSEQLKDKNVMGGLLVNIGETYMNRNKDDSALYYFKKSLDAYKNTENIPYALNDIGKLYSRQGNYILAQQNHEQALAFAKNLDLQLDIAQSYMGLGNTYYKKKDYKEALKAYKNAETTASETNLKKELRDAYQGLALTYAGLKDFNDAFRYQTLFTNIKDTLFNLDIAQKVGNLQTNFEIQKKQGQIDILTKDKALQELELNKQRLTRNALIGGLVLILIIAFLTFRDNRNKIKTNKLLDSQKVEIENLLLNILPTEVAQELRKNGFATPRYYEKASVLFTDFKSFTKLVDLLTPQEIVSELNACFIGFDDIIEKYNLEKIKTIGDSYMCAGGITSNDESHPVNIVKASLEIQEFIRSRNKKRKEMGMVSWDVRIGINIGPVVAGVVGRKKYAYDIWGGTVNIASRMESNGEPGRVNISAATYELIKDKYACTHRGKIFAKNVGEIDMYYVEHEITGTA